MGTEWMPHGLSGFVANKNNTTAFRFPGVWWQSGWSSSLNYFSDKGRVIRTLFFTELALETHPWDSRLDA